MSLWIRIEPLRGASEQLRRTRKASTSKHNALVTQSATFDEAFAEFAAEHIERVTEIIDLLETYAIAEVELIDTEHEIEAIDFVGHELWIDLEIAIHEVTPEPLEVFVALYELFAIGKEAGLYSVEITEEDEPLSIDAMLSKIAALARAAGYELEDDAAKPAVDSAAKKFSKSELFFLAEAKLTWPASAAAVKKAWKQLAAAFHPDRNPGDLQALQKFRISREAYDKLIARAT